MAKEPVSVEAAKLGKIVRARRKRMGWTQQNLADELRLASPTEPSAIENGTRVFSPTTVRRYAKALDIDPRDLPSCFLWPDALLRLDREAAIASWDHPVTGKYASPKMLQLMRAAGRFDCTAVDDGALLLSSTPKTSLNRIPISHTSDAPCLTLVDPTAEQLLQFPMHTYQSQIVDFLREAAKEDEANCVEDTYQTKAGINQFSLPAPAFGANLRMKIVPLSFWTMKRFNRSFGEGAHLERINRMKEDAFLALMQNDGGLNFRFPSALYVEACVTTADDRLVLVEKNPDLSVMAKSGRRWTASLEEGLSWHYYAQADEIDAASAIAKGLKRELDVDLEHINDVVFDSLGIEYPTLNVGILGEVRLSLEAEELVSKIKGSDDYGRRYHFIEWSDVPEKVFFDPIAPPAEWHALARLRCFLGLERRNGFDDVVNMFS